MLLIDASADNGLSLSPFIIPPIPLVIQGGIRWNIRAQN
jgi:hypothetical protein